jgi:peptide/nickel transport system ATP-binding protein
MCLEGKSLSFGYKRSQLLLEVMDITVQAGERVALVGPSGCGKSTLTMILAGYLKPLSGAVLLDGKPLPLKGYCPVQLIYQHPEQAVNPRWKLGDTLAEAWEPSKTFLSEMGINPEWLNRYPTELSGGELQRICIARAFAPQTRFIIADEISTMLDMITQAQIWDLILKTISKRHIGLLAVTHSMELAERICTRIVSFATTT